VQLHGAGHARRVVRVVLSGGHLIGCGETPGVWPTHYFDERGGSLSATARTAIADPGNQTFVSIASAWQVAIR
jgi:hypothetical protein